MNSWIRLQLIVFAIITGVLIAFIGYAAHIGRLEGSSYRGVHLFFKQPSWKTWKGLYAALAGDIWGDMLLTYWFLTIPVPVVSVVVYLEFMLIKISLYKLSVMFTAGKPKYTPGEKVPVSDHVGIWVFLGLSILITVVTHFVTDMKTQSKLEEKEVLFKTSLRKTLSKVERKNYPSSSK